MKHLKTISLICGITLVLCLMFALGYGASYFTGRVKVEHRIIFHESTRNLTMPNYITPIPFKETVSENETYMFNAVYR